MQDVGEDLAPYGASRAPVDRDDSSNGRTANALKALESVYSMEWGRYFSRSTYLTVMESMMQTDRYWGGAWDQQQAYVDVQGIYFALQNGQMTSGSAKSALQAIRSQQLVPWLRADLSTLQSAWSQAASILEP